ncbi:MAG TPA: heme-binding protein [Xanthobacteraceae bacterium]|nr:heme-binding protein [Xanthobacteraceae bacterium]
MLKIAALATAVALLSTVSASAQQPPPAYGPPITLEAAKKAMAAAEAEATKNNWPVAIVILDSTGHVVMLHKMDNVQYASIKIAEGKAQTAVDFRRPSKALEDVLAGGGAGLRVLTFGNILVQGGVPIVADGKIVGSIGVSGVTSQQDEQIAMAGAAAAK